MPITDAYHADPCHQPSLSSTIARILLDQSPRHAWLAHPRLNPAYEPDNDSRADVGTVAHALLLQGDESGVVVIDAPDWRTKAAREQRDAAWADGKSAVLAGKMDDVRAMAAAASKFLSQSEIALQWGGAGDRERVITWDEDDITCRAKLDAVCGHQLVLDYKTAGNASPREWVRRSLFAGGYDVQAAFYLRGLSALAEPDRRFVFLVQEHAAPYACSLVGLTPEILEPAAAKVERAIAIWRHCVSSGEWPAYSSMIHWAEAPAWALADAERIAMEDRR